MRSFLLLLLRCLLLVAFAARCGHAEAPYTAAALAPDGKQVVLGSQAGIEIRSWPELVVTARLPTDLIHVHDLRFSPDGKTLLAAGGSPAEVGAVELLQWPNGKRIRREAGHTDVVYQVAWSPDGKHWATAGADGICQTFDAATGERHVRYDGHSRAVLSIGYLTDGRSIASAGVDQTLRLWDSATGKHLRTLDNHVGAVNGVAVHPAASMGFQVASEARSPPASAPLRPMVATISEDRTIRLWQPSIGRLMRFARLPSTPRSVAWSLDSSRLIVGCNDGRVRVLDSDSLEIVKTLDGLDGRIHELVIDPLASRVFIAGESGCRIVSYR